MTIKNGLPPIHPGVFLKEVLDELGISQNAFVQAIDVSPTQKVRQVQPLSQAA